MILKARRRYVRWLVVALAILVAGLVIAGLVDTKSQPNVQFERVGRRDVEDTVVAVGRLLPLQTIAVGAEASGLVQRVFVDVNDEVAVGQVLAQIEPQRLQAQVDQARSQIVQAEASMRQAQALAARASAMVERDRANYERVAELTRRGFATRKALEEAVAQSRASSNELAAARAQSEAARGQIAGANAAYRDATTAQDRTTIRSPVAGVVIERNVDPGQALASAFQAPVLFKVASDIARMQLELMVSEADIGRVKPGQEVRFDVAAFPERLMTGRVVRVSPNAVVESGTSSYLVLVMVDNSDRLLLPGMTANAQIVTRRDQNELAVPLEALQFDPATTPGALPSSLRVRVGRGSSDAPVASRSTYVIDRSPLPPGQGRVWKETPGGLEPVIIVLGPRDARHVVVRHGNLKVDDRVAISRRSSQ